MGELEAGVNRVVLFTALVVPLMLYGAARVAA
jgi:hypothetical protein